MTESLTSRVQVSISGALSNALDLVTGSASLAKTALISLANGTGVGKADMIWSDQRTLGDGVTEDIDIKAALTDVFGAAFTPAKIKALLIVASSSNTTALTLFGDANSVPILQTAATVLAALNAGGIFLIADPTGITVTAATGDIIQVANGAGAAATYDIVVIGASA